MSLILSIMLATVISWLIIPFMWKHALQLGFIDEPDSRKVHIAPIARVGGWGIVLGSLFSVILLLPMEPVYQSYVIGSIVLLLFGAWDDRSESGHSAKFIGQFLAVIPVVTYGGLSVETLPFMETGSLPSIIGIPFTAFAIIGVINALNHSDGLDGLAGGEALISLIAIAFLAYIYDGFSILVIACAVIGGILGFLRYNSYPAHVFMGDSGSQFLGFTLAFLVVFLTQNINNALSPALPLLLLGLPIIDIIAVLFLRIKGKMNWFRATKNHIHHRLLNLGFDHYESVVLIYSIHALFVISAIFMRYEWEYLIFAMYFFFVLSIFATLTYLERKKWRFEPGSSQNRLSKIVDNNKQLNFVRQLPILVLLTGVSFYLIVFASLANDTPLDISIAALLMLVAYVWSSIKNIYPNLLFRLMVYTTALFVVYLNIDYSVSNDILKQIEAIYFGIVALALVVAIRYSSNTSFLTTPTDYLILFLILIVTAMTGIDYEQAKVSAFVVKVVILLYAMELIIFQKNYCSRILTFSVLLSLGIIFVQGIIN